MKQIFPKEVIETTVEVHQFKHAKKSAIIYTIILGMIIVLLCSLPLIKITIYNTSQGLIKPNKERILLQSNISGKVTYHNLKNNSQVKKGDILLLIYDVAITQKISNTSNSIEEIYSFIGDLKILSGSKASVHKLQTVKYIQDHGFYRQKLNELTTRFRKIEEDYKRNQALFEKGVIAKVSLNDSKLEYDLSLNAIYQYKKQQKSIWYNQLVDYQNQLKELKDKQMQLEENSELFVLKSPTTGSLINVKGVENGSFIQSGTQLAEISPQSNLIIECLISPSDVGLLQEDGKVNFQVSAFNYNQWGIATGKIISIGKDIQMINNSPKFQVLCSLDQEFLQLKNGFKGHLKKGMLVNARFELTKRTLFELLYDKMDDWVNPSTQLSDNK